MPRCNRHFSPGLIWHITHRCHSREFLLRFSRDRQRWRHWLMEARVRYGLCVLDYVVTSNHIHLLVRDRCKGEIAASMQLISGRVGQEFNWRKGRKGAFWEDRYHATAVESGMHLARCLVYIDLNMVRAGVVRHPKQWPHGGYREIQNPLHHHRVIDTDALVDVFGAKDLDELQQLHLSWTEEALRSKVSARAEQWTRSVAVGSEAYVNQVKARLGVRARLRRVEVAGGVAILREERGAYDADSGSEIRPGGDYCADL